MKERHGRRKASADHIQSAANKSKTAQQVINNEKGDKNQHSTQYSQYTVQKKVKTQTKLSTSSVNFSQTEQQTLCTNPIRTDTLQALYQTFTCLLLIKMKPQILLVDKMSCNRKYFPNNLRGSKICPKHKHDFQQEVKTTLLVLTFSKVIEKVVLRIDFISICPLGTLF